MFDVLETILAAGRKKPGGNFQWLIPVGFAVFYILNVIGKIKEKKQQEENLDSILDREDSQAEPKRRYEPLADTPGKMDAPSGESWGPEREETQRESPSESELHVRQAGLQSLAVRVPQEKRHRVKPAPAKRIVQQVPVKPRQKVKSVRVEKEVKPVVKHAELPQVAVFKNLADTGNLRTAIVLAEILGKPLALREL